MFLQSYDVEAAEGRGIATWVTDIRHALVFDSTTTAVDFVRQVPACHPVRATDGLPNRPLTAFDLAIIPVEETSYART